MNESSPQLRDLEDAERAFQRIRPEADALFAGALSAMNTDVVHAASIALAVANRIIVFRRDMAQLPRFDLRNPDNLSDYAKAAWFAYVTRVPEREPPIEEATVVEAAALRVKLLRWAGPLAEEGVFSPEAVAAIRQRHGTKDMPSDLVALVTLYRENWAKVKVPVTERDLERGAELGPAVFALVSRRENKDARAISDGLLRARRAWTLLDRAYDQCRRAVAYLRYDEDDVDTIVPNLRRNPGRGKAARPPTETPVATDGPPPGDAAPAPGPNGSGPRPFSST